MKTNNGLAIIRMATVIEVDAEKAMCRVMLQATESGWLPWLVIAGKTMTLWRMPAIGERVLVLCPDNSLSNAAVLAGLYTKNNPKPKTASADNTMIAFGDGSLIEYDQATHALNATLAAGATATITADGGITLNGDVTVNGNVTAAGDVSDSAGSIQEFRDEYKKHTHMTNTDGPTGKPL